MIKWTLLLWPVMALSQPVYLNDDQGELDRAVVNRTLWAVNERFGTDFRVTGITSSGCIPDSVIIRRASAEEWAAAKLQLFGAPTALEHGCPTTTGEAIVFGPNLLNFRPFEFPVLEHEFLHALGVKWHLNNADYLLFSGPLKAKAMTQVDLLEASKAITWPHNQGNLCFAEVFDNYDFYIPSISGFGAYMQFVEKWKWKPVYYSIAPEPCEGFTIENGMATIPDARAMDGRGWNAVLEQKEGYWTLKSAVQSQRNIEGR